MTRTLFLTRAGKEKLITEIRDRAKRSIEQKVKNHFLIGDVIGFDEV